MYSMSYISLYQLVHDLSVRTDRRWVEEDDENQNRNQFLQISESRGKAKRRCRAHSKRSTSSEIGLNLSYSEKALEDNNWVYFGGIVHHRNPSCNN